MQLLLIFFFNLIMYFICSLYKKLTIKDLIITLIITIYNIILLNKVSTIDWINHLIISNFLGLVIMIDYCEYWIPDLSIIIIFSFNVIKAVVDNYYYNHNFNFSGMIFSILFFIIIILIELLLKKELLGFGDIKLIVVLMMGKSILYFSQLLLLSSGLGLVYYLLSNKKNKMVPFGPSIATAYLILTIFFSI